MARFTQFIFILLSVIVFTSQFTQARQSIIAGRVTELSTGDPLPGVNVYLAGSSIGTSSNPDGSFQFQTSLEGRFTLIASFLGFKRFQQDIDFIAGDTLRIDIQLQENLITMEEVQVTGERDTEWQQRYEDFRQFFLGWDDFAEGCTIENPTAIDFLPAGKNVLMVVFLEPLRISNYALGYHIEIENGQVLFKPRNHSGSWQVYPRYTEMKTTDPGQAQEWQERREEAYLGSAKHFFISLKNDELFKGPFEILPRKNAIRPVTDNGLLQTTYGRDWLRVKNYYHSYEITRDIRIAYDPIYNRLGDVKLGSPLNAIQVNNRTGVFSFDDHGNLMTPEQVVFFGKWAEHRYARNLPLDFVVE